MGFARYQVRRLRQEATETEKILWERLRDRRLQGLKLMRQCPIGPFVADFCCRERRVVVEVDGEGHSTGQGIARDRERDDYLRGQSYIVLRFTNEEVLADLEAVLRKDRHHRLSGTLHLASPIIMFFSPSPGEGGREGTGERAGG